MEKKEWQEEKMGYGGDGGGMKGLSGGRGEVLGRGLVSELGDRTTLCNLCEPLTIHFIKRTISFPFTAAAIEPSLQMTNQAQVLPFASVERGFLLKLYTLFCMTLTLLC